MIPMIRSTTIATSLSFLLILACGPGGFAMDGGELGSESTDTATPETTTTGRGDSSSGDTDTDTTGSDDWSDPDTETGEPEPEPFEPAQCTRDWTLVDSQPNHGHIGATPLGARIGGGFFTVHPLLGAGNDEVNVDAWFRAWSADGAVEWERLGKGREGLWSAAQVVEARVLEAESLREREREFLSSSTANAARSRLLRRVAIASVPLVVVGTYAGVSLQGVYEIERKVDAMLEEAGGKREAAQRLATERSERRRSAFERFDGRDVDGGEV